MIQMRRIIEFYTLFPVLTLYQDQDEITARGVPKSRIIATASPLLQLKMEYHYQKLKISQGILNSTDNGASSSKSHSIYNSCWSK